MDINTHCRFCGRDDKPIKLVNGGHYFDICFEWILFQYVSDPFFGLVEE